MAEDGPPSPQQTFVLCFDGTGNKFSGTDSDSNILKIYRMLDRTRGQQFHYYQPGIGTYTTSASLSHTSAVSRMYSWYLKSKDSMIGSSFDAHVMGGYKFLMRYYTPGDDIYFFGFSRGAYIARFLAEMLDYVGLLSAGNEELIRFAWKTFATWQQRHGEAEEDEKKRRELFHFMKAFRETFSRPVRRIRFLGLFDTVNSVPRFENAWMRRSRHHPYTARSSAKVIRHAVGIDERRAKFRQDLISGAETLKHQGHHNQYRNERKSPGGNPSKEGPSLHIPSIVVAGEKDPQLDPKRSIDTDSMGDFSRSPSIANQEKRQHRPEASKSRTRDPSLAVPVATLSNIDLTSLKSGNTSQSSLPAGHGGRSARETDDAAAQDIKEVWFAGGHADIGGGWSISPHETVPLSHTPLVWMVQEAEKAGLKFDRNRMKQMNCCNEDLPDLNFAWVPRPTSRGSTTAAVDFAPSASTSQSRNSELNPEPEEGRDNLRSQSSFLTALRASSNRGHLHDPLSFETSTLPTLTVLSWHVMEYLPFRRMDLQPDGSWRAIRWPLPKGEVRDMPATALIHNSVIERMKADQKYRPGNLIVGGAGGRGVKKAPESWGMGSWVSWEDEGDPVREVLVRRGAVKTDEKGEKVLVGLDENSKEVMARR